MSAKIVIPRSSAGQSRYLALAAAVALGALAGCAYVPQEPVVQGPTTTRPPPPPVAADPEGSIYRPLYSNRPLFEDRRPRNVGDILTIVINENTAASKNSAANTNRSSSGSLTLNQMPGVVGGVFNNQSLNASGGNKFDAKGAANANNVFSGQITVTVMDVLPNGNLAVAGEKQIAINQGTEYIKFSGIVSPQTISGSNTVPSTQVADARIEYRGKGYINEAETMGWLQRFFLNVSPF
ncbi:flagellar basal body L-ring protein FlgH [Pandoraea nosoerga]|uniref:Flagellar L-ring protein n=1 Tax=Pandoraea nosoerga TaxID=2508296 RepID=A0A5E4XXJ2_9BURK|nr:MULTISPECIES: flagellar basal body L-ring protein FlgH [Pandoraea]MBN4664808.1 flagellar basal body L-ring protein FlgH [Pandoraea nosoerga]MBN4674017.1 flagellar basal body L-ring protein FlgH [Pandoraea nosoerga]MBN4680048.1 flagellar basal body L-ring protein FlgH [Pandoraea nosoerga]MBN4744240.1 flagellar basal body L-ring protein FlgH [Pandoraea nosoerga]VVE40812.1 flagellar basal body L-ring protein [Pandoraea nosoerga]